jgi:hypothetical protein
MQLRHDEPPVEQVKHPDIAYWQVLHKFDEFK